MIKIEYLEEEMPVYDITVEDNHNFYANDILVHNCTEIVLPSRPSELINEELFTMENGEKRIVKRYTAGEIALCNLSSVNLERWFYMDEGQKWQLIRTLVRGLDNTVDVANYPVKEGKNSNLMYRYLGIGVLNFANYLALKEIIIDTQEALEETDKLFDDLSYIIISVSAELAEEKGKFEKFYETKWAEGILPIDLANKETVNLTDYLPKMDRWNKLREKIKVTGLRNAALMAIAPTACSEMKTEIKTNEGIKSLQNIMDDFNIDYNKIMNEETQQWLDFKTEYIGIVLENGDIKHIPTHKEVTILKNNIEVKITAGEICEGMDIVYI